MVPLLRIALFPHLRGLPNYATDLSNKKVYYVCSIVVYVYLKNDNLITSSTASYVFEYGLLYQESTRSKKNEERYSNLLCGPCMKYGEVWSRCHASCWQAFYAIF